MKTFTVPQAPGSKRSSDHRTYTHAVIGRFDYDAKIKDLLTNRAKLEASYRASWSYSKRGADTLPGEQFWSPDRTWYWIHTVETHTKETAFIAAHPDVEVYVQACFEATLLSWEERKTEAADRYVVLQWSQSERAAAKGLGAFRHQYKDLWVAPTVEVVKKRRPTLGAKRRAVFGSKDAAWERDAPGTGGPLVEIPSCDPLDELAATHEDTPSLGSHPFDGRSAATY